MTSQTPRTETCQVCHEQKSLSEMMAGELVQPSVAELIRQDHPQWNSTGYICLSDLNYYRTQYIEDMVEAEKGELSTLEKEVLTSLQEHELLTQNVDAAFERQLTLGERWADHIAAFGGSWRFVILFCCFLLAWIITNAAVLLWRPFDPYPFILLNLILSCLAAMQAPIIMMSQNRQEDRDRMRGEHDYRVNLKAELEIRHLNDKLDHLIMNQWGRLMDIQRIQVQIMEEMTNHVLREGQARKAPPSPS